MDVLKLCFVLLLPQTLCFDREVTLVKTVGTEPDVTPLCTNETLDQIVCKIRLERTKGEECRLLYDGHDFNNTCGSKIKLVTINQTVFLHLSSLTPADGGNYSCECVNLNGIFIYHLNITVEANEEDGSFTEGTFPRALVGVTVFIAVTSVILGVIYKKLCHRDCFRSETPDSFDEDDPDETYTSLQQTDRDLYQTITSNHQHDTERDSAGRAATFNQNYHETDPNCEIYENI